MLTVVLQTSLCSLCLALTCAYVIQDQGYRWQHDQSHPQHQQNYHYEVPYQYSNTQLSVPEAQYPGSHPPSTYDHPQSNQAEDKFSEVRKLRLKGNRNRFKQQFKKGRRRCKHPGRPRHHRRPHRGRNPFYPDDLRGYRRIHSPDPYDETAYVRGSYNKYPKTGIQNFGGPKPRIEDRSDDDYFVDKRWNMESSYSHHNSLATDVGGQESFSEINYTVRPLSKPYKTLLIPRLKAPSDQKTDKIVLYSDKYMSELLPNRFNVPQYRNTIRRKSDIITNNRMTENSMLEHNIIPPLHKQRPVEKNRKRFNQFSKRIPGSQRTVTNEHEPCEDEYAFPDTTTTKYTLIQIAKGTVNVLDPTTDSTSQASARDTVKSTQKNYFVTDQSSIKNGFYPIVGYTTPLSNLKNSKKSHHQDLTVSTDEENVITVTPAVAFPISDFTTPNYNSIWEKQQKLMNFNNSRTVKSLGFYRHEAIQPRKIKDSQVRSGHNSDNDWKPVVMTQVKQKDASVANKPNIGIDISSPSTENSLTPIMTKITQEDARLLPQHLIPKKHAKREDRPSYRKHFLPAVQRRSWINTKSDDLTAVVSSHIVVQ